MAVGIRLKLAGVTAEQFDRLNAAIDPDGNPPDGLVLGRVRTGRGRVRGVVGASGNRAALRPEQQRNVSGPDGGHRAYRGYAGSPRVPGARALPPLARPYNYWLGDGLFFDSRA